MCGQNSPPFLFYVKTLQMSNTPFYIQQRRLLPSALHPSFFCSYRVCAERALLYSIVSANMKFSQNCSYLTLLRLLLLLRLKGGSHVFCFLLRKNICYNAKKSTPSKRTANGLLTIKPCCFSYNSVECLADSNLQMFTTIILSKVNLSGIICKGCGGQFSLSRFQTLLNL